MPPLRNLSGQRFSKLLVSTKHKIVTRNTGRRVTYWKCICDCGKNVFVASSGLINKHSKSCGCSRFDGRKLPLGEAVFNALYRRCKAGAKQRNFVFRLTKAQYKSIASKPCHYCKTPPKAKFLPHSNGPAFLNGIDRVDNNKGYTLDNCVSCCWLHNVMKGKLTQKEFIQGCISVAKQANSNNDMTTINMEDVTNGNSTSSASAGSRS